MDNFLFLPRALAAAAFDTSFAGAVGVLAACLWLNGSGDKAIPAVLVSLQRALILCAACMVLILPLQLWVLTGTMVGSSSVAQIAPQLAGVLTGTHAGRVLIPAFTFAVLLLVFSTITASVRHNRGVILGLIFVTGLAAMRSASGHPAADGDFTLSEGVQLIHLSSIAVWGGGVMVAGLLVLPPLLRSQSFEIMTRFAGRLSYAVTYALLAVMLSGIYNAWRGLGGRLPPLIHTQWGALLDLKTVLVLTALALGATNRLLLRRNSVLLEPDAAYLTQWMRLEALVMVGILAVSGFLANSPPATGP
jgi:putative copper resistance protein D